VLARSATRVDEFADLLSAGTASSAGAACLAHLVHRDCARIDGGFDLTMRDALADADDHVSGTDSL